MFGRIKHFTLFRRCLFANRHMFLNAVVIKVSATNVACYAIGRWCTGDRTLFEQKKNRDERLIAIQISNLHLLHPSAKSPTSSAIFVNVVYRN